MAARISIGLCCLFQLVRLGRSTAENGIRQLFRCNSPADVSFFSPAFAGNLLSQASGPSGIEAQDSKRSDRLALRLQQARRSIASNSKISTCGEFTNGKPSASADQPSAAAEPDSVNPGSHRLKTKPHSAPALAQRSCGLS